MKTGRIIEKLTDYAKVHLELDERDCVWTRNRLLAATGAAGYLPEGAVWEGESIETLLDELVRAGVSEGLFGEEDAEAVSDTCAGLLMLPPSQVADRFRAACAVSPENGMKWLYDYSVLSDYVKKEKLDKNPRRTAANGLIVTINLSKPEFRSAKSAAAGNSAFGGYPACAICRDNEGFGPRNKRTLRTVPLTLDGEPWFWQFSPYGYFYRHGIAVNTVHTPMHVNESTFRKLMDFTDLFPDFFIGCNAPLPRIGGSVLAHDHYQGGQETLPLFTAKPALSVSDPDSPSLKISVLDWYSTAVRLEGTREEIVKTAEKIRTAWESYSDETREICAVDANGKHNAVSPTCRKTADGYVMDILLRSNCTSEKYPDGIFHAHPEYHSVKKESIGLIEAQGLFILPGRLQRELGPLQDALEKGLPFPEESEPLRVVWDAVKPQPSFTQEEAGTALFEALGEICRRILENTAVFKTPEETKEFLEKEVFYAG